MWQKFIKVIKNPKIVLWRIKYGIAGIIVRQVEKDGQIFYKYKGELYPEYLKKKKAAPNIFATAKKYCQGQGIDIGAGDCPFLGSIPVENEEKQNAFKLDNFKDNSLDYIFSSHCLEHLAAWQKALKLWIKKIKPGGILFLYSPHVSMPLWRPGGWWVFDNHKWSPTHEVFIRYLKENGLEIVGYNPGKDRYWSFYVVARKKYA